MVYPNLIKEERRKSERIESRCPVRYQFKGQPEYFDTVTRDIGQGGLRFITSQFVPNFSEILLELSLRSSLEPVRAAGKIAWTQKLPHCDRYQVGVQFTDISNSGKKNLINRLQMLKQFAFNPA